MSGLFDVLLAVAVIGLVIARQVRPRQISGGRRWWLIPAVLVVLGVRDGGLIDSAHREASIALLAVELVLGVAIGLAWMQTTRLWSEGGKVWAQGTKASVTVWVVGIVARAGLYGAGAAAGVHQKSGSVLLAVGITVFIRSGLLVWRAQSLGSSYREVA